MVNESFGQYLSKQLERDDPIGDLARDTEATDLLSDALTPVMLYDRLRFRHATPEVFEALTQAFNEFEKTQPHAQPGN